MASFPKYYMGYSLEKSIALFVIADVYFYFGFGLIFYLEIKPLHMP